MQHEGNEGGGVVVEGGEVEREGVVGRGGLNHDFNLYHYHLDWLTNELI